jgi:hypothetical protein
VDIADELNVYADPGLVAEAKEAAAAATRPVSVSVFLSWEWDKWPADPEVELDQWRSRGVERACISLAGPNMVERVERVADWQGAI